MKALDRWIAAKRRVVAVEELTPDRPNAWETTEQAIIQNGVIELAKLELRLAEQDLLKLLGANALPTIVLEPPSREELRSDLNAAKAWVQHEADRWDRCVIYDRGRPHPVITARPKRLTRK